MREAEAVRIRNLVLRNHQIDASARIDAIAIGGELALCRADLGGLPEAVVEPAGDIARTSRGVGRAFIELAAVGRVGEPVAAVGMRHDVVGRIQSLALVGIGQNGDRAVELIAHHTAREMFTGELAALEIEGVAVGVVRRHPKDADVPVVFEPAQLPIVRNVTPDQIATLCVPSRTFRPERSGPESLDGAVGLGVLPEGRIDGKNIGVGEVCRRSAARPEVARRGGDGARRSSWSRLRLCTCSMCQYHCTDTGTDALDDTAPR